MILAFNKPYGVISQFSPDGSANRTLADFAFPPNVYPIGRLDADSEGLLLLSDEKEWTDRLLNPNHAHSRRYLVQVERIPDASALQQLAKGVLLQGYKTKPATVHLPNPQPEIEPRVPPIRFRKNVPDSWIELDLIEGKNRQVRKMTAAVGHPTLRLIRIKIGAFALGSLEAGKWRELLPEERKLLLQRS